MSPFAGHDQGAAAWAPRRRPGLLALVLLAHALLLLGWQLELTPNLRGAPPDTRQSALVWLQLAPVAPPGAARRPETHPPSTPAAAAHAVKPPAAAPSTRPIAQPDTVPAMAPAPIATAIHLPAPEAPASAASAPPERIMDSAATRAAIRQTGRTALLAERAAGAIDQPFVSKGEKETQAFARSAKGDCLKGEFGGGGGGLLSIPFFVVAEVSGHCGK